MQDGCCLERRRPEILHCCDLPRTFSSPFEKKEVSDCNRGTVSLHACAMDLQECQFTFCSVMSQTVTHPLSLEVANSLFESSENEQCIKGPN